ncbi:DNA-directed RNA polymerase subunit beta' [Gulosibacter chungangensis]|uniref:DNA-directed RNA polymerase subunit beta' n=1 Tax=Gulosibacter chungangensis TaxID=979746 RepID=A0A7J5BEJ2_9MICO|nr:DNA-directed RNA polymerase subunit beta' [Gulosibacter chungangensis]KAB1644713.1 DNA-directed RNA polymerase subunit beta' [Gulosibacter chungangensis]
MIDATKFDSLSIGLATTEDILGWSRGEVKKPETINYRTLKPEKDGLFGEQIFGPSRDWECACGKYKRVRFKGIICERCGVEVTKSAVRRERMGHIKLAAPVTHIWYFKGVPSRLGYLLDMAPKDLEKVIYFAAYMVVSIDEEGRHDDLSDLEKEKNLEVQTRANQRDSAINERLATLEKEISALEEEGATADQLKKAKDAGEKDMARIRKELDRDIEQVERVWESFKNLKVGELKPDDADYAELEDRYGDYFEAHMGAEAIQNRLRDFDLETEAESLREQIQNGKGQKKIRAIKRLRVVNAFLQTDNKPEAMVLDIIPVIPPELRPMVQLDGGRFATSDLNDLYRRVINRNNRLQRLLDLGAPEIIVNNEKRMLQEAVDALFDNGRRGRAVTGTGNRALKSLSDMLKGKQGRFRQNLLGKRVDYSGRSVIIVGPQLQMHQCGLPKQMALELFKPYVIKRLIDLGHASNIKAAKRSVERAKPEVWDVLEEVIRERPVLLNRAPTLHRLGIQAFEPLLVEGKAIQLHPLACSAFNADFDGDQMAVHLPLSVEAQAEARVLMLASNNILKPSDGRPVTLPSQDMVAGLYHLTFDREDAQGAGRSFGSVAEAIMAQDEGTLHLNAPVKIRLEGLSFLPGQEPEGFVAGKPFALKTTLGRALFNELLPATYPYLEDRMTKGRLSDVVNYLAERFDKDVVAATLDRIKDAGFYWATRSGISLSVADVVVPDTKEQIIAETEAKVAELREDYAMGLSSQAEYREKTIALWEAATEQVAEDTREQFPDTNSIHRMVTAGANGNWLQVRQIAGMRGIVANPKGEKIARPIIHSYREGLTVLEYFSSTHGARKGLADTALKTADSGYLTRRLVDVSQDVIIREEDCGTRKGLKLPIAQLNAAGERELADNVENSVYARTLATDVVDAAGEILAQAGEPVGDVLIERLYESGIEEVAVRSVLTCESQVGVCSKCYGRSMASSHLADMGEAVGIIAAQSIGEPGTQLTMRTFHTGGVASGTDITQGLPRVQELFEARTPKGAANLAKFAGTISIQDTERSRKIILTPDAEDEEVMTYPVSKRSELFVEDGERVEPGKQLVEGPLDPKEVLEVLGTTAVQKYLVKGVQEVYNSQGVPIHDKHIEVIVRQMLRKVTINDSGETDMLPGELVDRQRFQAQNRQAVQEGQRPASGRPEVMGITKASLATESWLSAASFQETTRVLTQAAMEQKADPLLGLKENVIIGRLITAGTGLPAYAEQVVEPTEEAIAERYPYVESSEEFGDSLSYADFDAFSEGDNFDFGLEPNN